MMKILKLGFGNKKHKIPKSSKRINKQLQTLADNSLLISIDQEGGEVHRLRTVYGFDETPSWNHIGLLNNELMTEQFSSQWQILYLILALTLILLLFLILITVGTVISDSKRAFSSDPKTVREFKNFYHQHKQAGVITCGKHFRARICLWGYS